jgi:hypothetical protein
MFIGERQIQALVEGQHKVHSKSRHYKILNQPIVENERNLKLYNDKVMTKEYFLEFLMKLWREKGKLNSSPHFTSFPIPLPHLSCRGKHSVYTE